MARLVSTIEGEIVPRLVLTRRLTRVSNEQASESARAPDPVDVAELVRLLLAHDVGVSSAYVETVRQRGASLEAICLGLLAPAARRLGELWEEDECNFMQVTVGLCRLHQLLRELSPEFRTDEEDGKTSRRILLAPCPGEQHTFGVSVVAQFLRRAGWDVWHEFPATHEEMLRVFCQHRFSVVGLSIASETRLDELKATIRAIRHVSRNRAVGILVGGPILVIKPELAASLGADAMAVDGPQAVLRAEQICSALATVN
ncbi:MAG: cobalamin B12-binding domain-containing protein [Steroidobacteraceae bacterium]